MKAKAIGALSGASLLALVQAASAAIIVQHSGSTDPSTEGFTNDVGGLPVPGSPVVGPPAAWNINGPWCCDYSMYTLSAGQTTTLLTHNWRLTAIMQNLNTGTGSGAGIYADVLFAGGFRYDIDLTSDGAGNQVLGTNPFGGPGSNYTIAGLGTNYATFVMAYDAATATADYYVNGSLAIANSPGFDYGWPTSIVIFGGVDGNFQLVSLTTGVPEPSTWAMLALGFAGLGFAGYRKARVPSVIA
jgi:hypothetical protein